MTRQLIRTDPRVARELLAEAERDGIWVVARRHGVQHSTIFRWRERRAVDPAWPDDAYVARWLAAHEQHAEKRAKGRVWAEGYRRDRYFGRMRRIDATGSTRRIQALYALGWTSRQLAPRLGVSYARVGHLANGLYPSVLRSTAKHIADLYDELSMTVPQDGEHLERHKIRVHDRQRRLAAARGWAPPLAWDDIDDPEEIPTIKASDDQADGEDIDPVVVQRILAGEATSPTTRAERVEVVRRWEADGRSLGSLERLTGWKTDRYAPEARASMRRSDSHREVA